jgi:protein SCO1/2
VTDAGPSPGQAPPPPVAGAGAEPAAAQIGRRRPFWRVFLPPLALLLVLVGALSLVLTSGSSRPAVPAVAQPSTAGAGFFGTLTVPSKPAPAIELRNYLGRPVTLAEYRGRAVLVTFIYTHCPDVCPLITSNLRVAMNQLRGQASRAQIIAVSVDPRGDTPAAVAGFLRAHGMVGRMQYLIGSPAELARTWAAWSVGSKREVGQPDLVEHSALIYGVSASGRMTTIYPATFEPGDIVHDVPKLASR